MNTESDMELPPGTAVYCCARRLVLDFNWRSRLGLHIVRVELPLAFLQTQQRVALCAAARQFRQVVAMERSRVHEE